MRSFFTVSHRRLTAPPMTVAGLSLATSQRSIFIRDAYTQAALTRGSDASSETKPLPARLLWQFRSSHPRHLVLCVRGPASAPSALTSKGGASFEELESDEAAAAANRTSPEAYIYGRLFLRPFNVAQLLTVLQGWSEKPAVVQRARSSLQLSAVPTPGCAGAVSGPPRAVQLTAQFTHKVFTRVAEGHERKGVVSAASPTTDLDPEAEEDFPNSVYVDGDMGTVTTTLQSDDLVFLTAHLESVLSDFFGIEHHYIKNVAHHMQEAHRPYGSGRFHNSANPRYLSQQQQQQQRQRDAFTRNGRVQYLSDAYRTRADGTAVMQSAGVTAVHHVTSPPKPPAAASVTDSVEEDVKVAEVEQEKASTPAPTAVLSPAATHTEKAPSAAATTATSVEAAVDEDAAEAAEEYEEIDEEVEEGEEERPNPPEAEAATASTPKIDAGGPAAATSTAATPVEDIAEEEEDVKLEGDDEGDGEAPREEEMEKEDHPVKHTAPATAVPAASPSATTYTDTQTRDHGTVTAESSDRYSKGRFMRDGDLSASEVEEVSRVGDFDMVRRTQQAQGSMEKSDTKTTVQATSTEGAFRSPAGHVQGTFTHERVSSVTVTDSAAKAAAGDAESFLSSRAPAETADESDADAATTEVKATAVKATEETPEDGAETHREWEEENNEDDGMEEEKDAKAASFAPPQQEAVKAAEAAKAPKRRSNSNSSGAANAGKKKRATKKKPNKAKKRQPKAKAAPAASAAASSGSTMTF